MVFKDIVLVFYAAVASPHLSGPRCPESDGLWPPGYERDKLQACSASATISDSIVPSALTNLSVWTIQDLFQHAGHVHRAPHACKAKAFWRPTPIRNPYDMETSTITATKNRKNKAIAPRKIAPTTASTLRFGLNIEPSGTLASSGCSGS